MATIDGGRPEVISIRGAYEGTPLVPRPPVIPLIIGTSLGKNNRVTTPESVTKSSIDGQDQLANAPLSSVITVSDTQTGSGTLYRNGTDYTFINTTFAGSSVSYIDWSVATTIDVPALTSLSASTIGTIPPGTYYMVNTAIRRRSVSPTIYGETTQSNELNITLTSTGGIIVNWNTRIGAEGYKIYLATATGSYTDRLATTVTGGGIYTTTLTSPAVTAGTPPGTNTTRRQPPTNADYYVDYYYKTYSWYTKTRYTALENLQIDHGKNSQVGIAGRLVMGRSGRGSGAAQCFVIAVEDHSYASHALAMAEAATISDLLLVVPLTNSQYTLGQYFAHVSEQSSIWRKKERHLFCGPAIGTTYGDSDTADTIIYNARTFGSEGELSRRVHYVSPDGIYLYVEDDEAGTTTETLYSSYMLAALYAGLISALPDTAEPATNDRLYGLSRLYDGTFDITDETIRSLQNSNGVAVFYEKNGVMRVYHSITTALTTIEDSEASIAITDDYLAMTMREALENQAVVGTKGTPRLLGRCEQVARAVLNQFRKGQLIADFESPKARFDADDARIVWIVFRYEAMYPANLFIFERGFIL